MMRPSCFRANILLERRAAGIREAERLTLEEHLSTCATCRKDADALGALRALAETARVSLPPHTRARLLDDALRSAARAEPRPMARRSLWVSVPVAAVAATFALVHLAQPSADPEAPSVGASVAVTPVQPATAEARVLAGEVQADGKTLERGMALANGARLYSQKSSRLRLGRAQLELAADTAIRWDEASATVQLDKGQVLAQVDRDPAREFKVSTQHFVVVVTGTRFAVTPERVQVSEGSVRVVDHEGRVLEARLQAGQSYEANRPMPSEAAPAAETTSSRAAAPRPQPRTDGSGELLARARTHLAAGEVHKARALLSQAQAQKLSRAQRAEAETLRAECALVERDHAAAVRAYLEVADRYPELPAAENALFAAARLTLQHGSQSEAHALFSRYLARYPSGRFHAEARMRVQKIGAARNAR